MKSRANLYSVSINVKNTENSNNFHLQIVRFFCLDLTFFLSPNTEYSAIKGSIHNIATDIAKTCCHLESFLQIVDFCFY